MWSEAKVTFKGCLFHSNSESGLQVAQKGRAALDGCSLLGAPAPSTKTLLQRFGLIAFEGGHADVKGGEVCGHSEDGIRIESEASLMMEGTIVRGQSSCGVRAKGLREGPMSYQARGAPMVYLVGCTFSDNLGGSVAYMAGAFPAALGCT